MCKKTPKKTKEVVTPEREELVRDFFTSVDPTATSNGYAVLPYLYIKVLTEPHSSPTEARYQGTQQAGENTRTGIPFSQR